MVVKPIQGASRRTLQGTLQGAFLLAICVFFGAGSAFAGVEVKDAWVAEPPPGAMSAAGFMQIHNSDSRERTLLQAHSPVCKHIEFHQSIVENNIARMDEVEQIVIEPNSTFTFELGGYHLMLIRPEALHVGERVKFELEFDGGEQVTVEAEVRKLLPEP